MRWKGIGALAAVAVLGAVVGQVVSAGDEPPATRSVQLGAVTLAVTGAWRPVDAATLSNGLQSMRVTLAPAAGSSLLPDGVTASGKPRDARLGGYRAWSYGNTTVLPTTRGVVAIECACAGAIRSVSVAGAAILAPAPDLAARLRAPAVLAKLDAVRVEQRLHWTPGLGGTPGDGAPRGADRARPDGDARARPCACRTRPHAYDALALTPSGSQADLAAADSALDAAVASLARAGKPRVQRQAAPAGGGVSLLTLLLVLATAVLLSALAPAALRRLRTRRAARHPIRARADREGLPAHAPPADRAAADLRALERGAARAGRRPGGRRLAVRYGVVVDNVNVSVLE